MGLEAAKVAGGVVESRLVSRRHPRMADVGNWVRRDWTRAGSPLLLNPK